MVTAPRTGRPQTRRPRKKKRFSGPFWAFYKLLVLFSALVVITHFGIRFLIPTPEMQQPPAIDPGGNSSNVNQGGQSVVSTTERKKGFYTFLLVGCDNGNGNADTIIVVGFDTEAGSVGMMSIPRDTISQRSWTTFPRINAAFGKGGIDLVKEEVSAMLGIPIDYHVLIELDAFVKVVDAIGGIRYDVPFRMYHDDEGGFVINLQPGEQDLTGRKVLELVRYRGIEDGYDIGRTQRQQQVLKAIGAKLLSWNSLTKVGDFAKVFQAHVKTNLSYSDMFWFAQKAMGVDFATGLSSHTPLGRGDAIKNGTKYVYELDIADTVDAVNRLVNPFVLERTKDDMLLVRADGYIE